MKKRLLMILAGVLLATGVFAGDTFKYSIWFGDVSPAQAANAFGRLNGTTDGFDEDIDLPIPPTNPERNPGEEKIEMNIMVFRAVLGTEGSSSVDNSTPRLAQDYRNPNNDGTTWTMDVTVQDAKILSWEAVTPLTNKNATLELVTPNGVSVDMRKQTSISNPVSGTYSIKYKKSSSVQEAPETPELIETQMAIYEGGSISFKVLDPAKYEFAGNPSCRIAFFTGIGTERERLEGVSETDGLVADSATGCITYTFDTSLDDYDEAVITYCFRYKSGTRAENTAVAYGSVRAVDVDGVLLKMVSDETLSVDIKSEEPSANSCTLSYQLVFTSGAPNGRMITQNEPQDLTAILTVPQNFTVTPPDGMGDEGSVDNADGSKTITYSYTVSSNDSTFDFTLAAQEGAKKGKASLEIKCKFPTKDDEEKSYSEAENKTATINVKGSANLDIDESADGTEYDLTDIQLIYNYAMNNGKINNDRLLSNTAYADLSGEQKTTKANDLRSKIEEMLASLDVDESANGEEYDLTDIQLIYNYAMNNGKTNNDRLLSNTAYADLPAADKTQKAQDLRTKIEDMIVK